MFQISSGRLGEDKSLSPLFGKRTLANQSQTNHHHHHHHHHVQFLGCPMFLRPFGLCCSACFGILFVSINKTDHYVL